MELKRRTIPFICVSLVFLVMLSGCSASSGVERNWKATNVSFEPINSALPVGTATKTEELSQYLESEYVADISVEDKFYLYTATNIGEYDLLVGSHYEFKGKPASYMETLKPTNLYVSSPVYLLWMKGEECVKQMHLPNYVFDSYLAIEYIESALYDPIDESVYLVGISREKSRYWYTVLSLDTNGHVQWVRLLNYMFYDAALIPRGDSNVLALSVGSYMHIDSGLERYMGFSSFEENSISEMALIHDEQNNECASAILFIDTQGELQDTLYIKDHFIQSIAANNDRIIGASKWFEGEIWSSKIPNKQLRDLEAAQGVVSVDLNSGEVKVLYTCPTGSDSINNVVAFDDYVYFTQRKSSDNSHRILILDSQNQIAGQSSAARYFAEETLVWAGPDRVYATNFQPAEKSNPSTKGTDKFQYGYFEGSQGTTLREIPMAIQEHGKYSQQVFIEGENGPALLYMFSVNAGDVEYTKLLRVELSDSNGLAE